jgi:hypothetical protein
VSEKEVKKVFDEEEKRKQSKKTSRGVLLQNVRKSYDETELKRKNSVLLFFSSPSSASSLFASSIY